VGRLRSPDAPISLQLLTSGRAVKGERYKFVVRISNSSDAPVPLTPCPYYRVQYLPQVEGGYLNCAAAPDAIPAGGHVDFAMEMGVLQGDPELGGTYDLLWQLAARGPRAGR